MPFFNVTIDTKPIQTLLPHVEASDADAAKVVWRIKYTHYPEGTLALRATEVVFPCEGCEDENCKDCCYHEFDYDEGGMCCYCGKDGYEHNADNYCEDDR